MDIEKYNTLVELVRDAKAKDRDAHDDMVNKTAEWKKVNTILTDRLKVLDEYISSCKNEAISINV